MEYLVAAELAGTIVASEASNAHCSEAWALYQTHEVSDHFQLEVERVRVERDLSIAQRDERLTTAFVQLLRVLTDQKRQQYDEAIEEALYYAGKFKLNADAIVRELERII